MNKKTKSARNPWPIAIIAYFILFTAFVFSVVAYLSHQKMDLVRGDYYDDEIRYQQQLDRINRTQEISDKVAITYDSTRHLIAIALPSSELPVSGRIRLYRPSDETLDRDIKLEVGSDGVQRVDAKQMRSGLWKVRVYWTVDGREYFFGQTVIVDPAEI